MKSKIAGMLVASIITLPVFAGENGGSGSAPSTSASSTATGGAGGAGGAASGGSATGGNASGGTSTVSVSVSVPTGGSGSGTNGNGNISAAELGDVGEAGSSAYNTKATVDYGGSYKVKSVPSVLAPSLTATLSDTCMGSASFGLSVVGVGASGGITMVDEACVRRLDSREFRAMGLNDVALALLCQSEANRRAIEDTGRECPVSPKQTKSNTNPNSANGTATASSSYEYTDPIVRQRMGLAPLEVAESK